MNAAAKDFSALHQGLLHNLGENVTVARHASGLTQAELAAQAKLSRSSIGKIESFNTEDVSLSSVAAIAEAFDLPPFLLLLGKEDWNKLATIGSLSEMVKEGMARLGATQSDTATAAESTMPDVDRLAQLSRSELAADRAEAVKEIGSTASRILGQDTENRTKAITATVSAALGANMLPGLPIVNGVIAGILANARKRF